MNDSPTKQNKEDLTPTPVQTDIEDLNAPESLGRFQIINEVGRGATAIVYKAYDPQLKRFLAIKVLRELLARDDEYQKAFIREAQFAAKLTHPGIVTIFDVGITDGKPYIAMELLDGLTLDQVLQKQGQINLRTVLSIAIQLSSALNYAHQNGVIHRDIKPANIVVLKNKKTVKLTDFGIAQLSESLADVTKLSNKVLGTPEYMAPEQVLGQPMDNRSDLYSFGVLIYYLIMGRLPFSSNDVGQLFKKIVKSKAPPIVLHNKIEHDKINDDLNDLVRKLLQKKTKKRFQETSEVTAELRHIQNKLGGKANQKQKDFISLKLQWTATMAGIVFIAMCISLVVVFFVQKNALSGITFDYGRSIARMIAFESAESVVLGDHVGLNALVTESSQNEQLVMVNVMNLNNIILASSESLLVGEEFILPEQLEHQQTMDGINIYRRQLINGDVLFDIEMSIIYADTKVGELFLTFNAEAMNSASKVTLISMLIVMMITLFVIFIITFILARETSKNYIRISDAINKLAVGRYDARLMTNKNDEVGKLFTSFNFLAQQIEAQSESSIKDQPEVTIKKNIDGDDKTEGDEH